MRETSFQIRPATADDIDQLCNLAFEVLDTIHSEANDPRPVLNQVMKSDDDTVVVVAESARRLCGYTYATYKWRAEYSGETMEIIGLFGARYFRSKGGGRALIPARVERARRRGIRRV